MEIKNIIEIALYLFFPLICISAFILLIRDHIKMNKYRSEMLEEMKQHHKKMENMCVIDIRNLENDKDSK